MNDEHKFWSRVVGIISVATVVTVLGVYYLSNIRMKIFVENGYTRQTSQGQNYAQWIKEDHK